MGCGRIRVLGLHLQLPRGLFLLQLLYGRYYEYHCTLNSENWIGWMPLTLWLLLNLALGVPRLVFQSTPDGAVELDSAAKTGSGAGIFAASAKPVKTVGTYEQKARNLYVAAFLLQLVGIFTIFPALGSICVTFHMLRGGYIRRRFALTLSLAIMEFIAIFSVWTPILLFAVLAYGGLLVVNLGRTKSYFSMLPSLPFSSEFRVSCWPESLTERSTRTTVSSLVFRQVRLTCPVKHKENALVVHTILQQLCFTSLGCCFTSPLRFQSSCRCC